MILFIFLLFLLLLLFVPIPIKLKVNYKNNDQIHFYLYNKKIDISPKKEKKATSAQVPPKKTPSRFTGKKIFNKLRKNPFKPELHFKCTTIYSLEDPCTTAILDGVLNCFLPVLYSAFGLIFTPKKFEFLTFPKVNNLAFSFNIQIESIIYVNVAKIIYILIQ